MATETEPASAPTVAAALPECPQVLLPEDPFAAFLSDTQPLRAHVVITGLKRTRVDSLGPTMADVMQAGNFFKLMEATLNARESLESNALFERAMFRFEAMRKPERERPKDRTQPVEGLPTTSPVTTTANTSAPFADDDAATAALLEQFSEDDVVVRWSIAERKERLKIGVTTNFSGKPEMTASVNNIRGQGYSVEGHFQPSPQGATGRLNWVSHLPWIGRRSDLCGVVKRESFPLRLVDTVMESSLAASMEFGGGTKLRLFREKEGARGGAEEGGGPADSIRLTQTPQWRHQVRLGVTRRTLHVSASDALPKELVASGLGQRLPPLIVADDHNNVTAPSLRLGPVHSDKCFIRHEAIRSQLDTHDPDAPARQLYPLPVRGHFIRLVNEFALHPKTLWRYGSGGSSSSSGEEEDSLVASSDFWKCDIVATKLFPLLSILVLNISAKASLVTPLTTLAPQRLGSDHNDDSNGRGVASFVPFPDRCWLNNTNVRGYADIGPSTVSEAQRLGVDGDVEHYLTLGGEAAWAVSASLGFPFLLWPQNGLFGMHLFLDAGNCVNVWQSFAASRRLRQHQGGAASGATGVPPAPAWSSWCPRPVRSMRDGASHVVKEAFAEVHGSLGAGLVLNQIPFLGPVPSAGKLEFNMSVPWKWTPTTTTTAATAASSTSHHALLQLDVLGGSLAIGGGGGPADAVVVGRLFQHWKFGLTWTSQDE